MVAMPELHAYGCISLLTVVLQGNYENGFVYWIILMITFWILYSYLVPISLFVTLEIVKFWQGFLYINRDKEMKVPCTACQHQAYVIISSTAVPASMLLCAVLSWLHGGYATTCCRCSLFSVLPPHPAHLPWSTHPVMQLHFDHHAMKECSSYNRFSSA